MSSSPPSPSAPAIRRRKTYNEQFKREAIALAESIGQKQAATDLGIDRSLISAWKKALETEGSDAFRGKGHPLEVQAEMVRLRREVATLRMEREILKKATEFFIREPR